MKLFIAIVLFLKSHLAKGGFVALLIFNSKYSHCQNKIERELYTKHQIKEVRRYSCDYNKDSALRLRTISYLNELGNIYKELHIFEMFDSIKTQKDSSWVFFEYNSKTYPDLPTKYIYIKNGQRDSTMIYWSKDDTIGFYRFYSKQTHIVNGKKETLENYIGNKKHKIIITHKTENTYSCKFYNSKQKFTSKNEELFDDSAHIVRVKSYRTGWLRLYLKCTSVSTYTNFYDSRNLLIKTIYSHNSLKYKSESVSCTEYEYR
jgi:hypothetical protein